MAQLADLAEEAYKKQDFHDARNLCNGTNQYVVQASPKCHI